jgi:transposase
MTTLDLNSNFNVQKLLQEIAFLRHENKVLREDLAHFQELVRLLKHQKFAAKSEAYPWGVQTLFNESETEADIEVETAEQFGPWPLKPGKDRGRPVRKPLPRSLDRVRKVIDIAEDEKICPLSGAPLVKIGEEVSEKLAIDPAKLTVIETVRPKYICKCPLCTKPELNSSPEDQPNKIKIAAVEPCAIPKSMATASLLAFIAVSKYADALPLNRQESIFARSGIDLPRTTLANWMIKCGELIRPLINLAKDELLNSRVILADETRYQILKRSGKKATSQSYVWVFMRGDPGGPKVIIYEVGPSRSHTVALEFLDGYVGYLHTDGYEAYELLVARAPGITLVGDWVHVRRKFDEAVKAHGKLPGTPKAKECLQLINELFQIEGEIQQQGAEDRLKIRKEKSQAVTDRISKWANENAASIPPKSLTGVAINYMLERWPKLLHFLHDPILRLDTNPVENAIRPFAIGRKNWMFSDSMAGAESSAALYSLICMAKAAELNPYEYLNAVFDGLPKAHTLDEVAALLPWNWKIPSKV